MDAARGRGGGRGTARKVESDEIRATVIDHVINHGLSMRGSWSEGSAELAKINCGINSEGFHTNQQVLYSIYSILTEGI